ncbi:MAG: ABC transporter permease [Candidatus Helarchaeota archaeon]|nr:ABC transporter permease [Candidatus Helarchaeota archaeon]
MSTRKIKAFKLPLILFILLFSFCLLTYHTPIDTQTNAGLPQNTPPNLQIRLTYEFGQNTLTNQIINDNLLILSYANVTLVNTTVRGSIYVFNYGTLQMYQNSNVTGDVIISDYSKVKIGNSTVMQKIECRDSSVLELLNTYAMATAIRKIDSANITVINSSIAKIEEIYASGGQIQILNSTIGLVSLMGISVSQTFINHSTITMLIDGSLPFSAITGPARFNFLTGNFSYSTSERKINLTWIAWDSPIIDGFLNLTFQILVDGVFYTSLNGSGFHNQYVGESQILISELGQHNISVITIDGNGNNFTSTTFIEIIEYPTFPWLYFFIIVAIIALLAITAMSVLHYRQKQGSQSALGAIFKKELADNKIKIILFIAIAAVPGIILFFIFNNITRIVGSLSIDSIRSLVSMVFTLFLYYFALVFSITFGASSVANVRKSGTLSWFLSKPVRRWEFLWGKAIAYFITIILIMASTSIAFVLGGISFIDPLYIPDIISMGGYIFLIGICALIPLTAIVMLCSSVFKKPGLTILIPIMLLMVLPPLVSFLPILTRHEWPMLLSFSYYYEQLGNAWVYQGGGLFSTLGPTFGTLFGIDITALALTPLQIILILSVITVICFTLATLYLERKDVV